MPDTVTITQVFAGFVVGAIDSDFPEGRGLDSDGSPVAELADIAERLAEGDREGALTLLADPGINDAHDELRAALDAQEVPHQALEPNVDRCFGTKKRLTAPPNGREYPCPDCEDCQPQALEPIDDKVEAFRKKFFERTGERLQRTAVVEGLRAALESDCDYCGGDGGYRVTSGRMVDGKPVEKTRWVTCERCGGDEVVERDGDCKNVPCPDCQPQALEPVGEECPDCGRADCPWVMPEVDALRAAAEGIQDLEDAGLVEWITLRSTLEAAGWKLQRSQPEDERESTEEPCDCDPDMRIASDCDRLGCREARKSGAVQPDCQRESTEEGRARDLITEIREEVGYSEAYTGLDHEGDQLEALCAYRDALEERLIAATQSEQSHTEEGK